MPKGWRGTFSGGAAVASGSDETGANLGDWRAVRDQEGRVHLQLERRTRSRRKRDTLGRLSRTSICLDQKRLRDLIEGLQRLVRP